VAKRGAHVLPHEARDLRHVVLLHESLSVRPVSARHAGELAHHVIARTAPALVPAGDAGLRALILIEHVHRTLEEVDGGLLLAELVVRGREVVERGAEAERALGHVLLRDHEALLQKWDGLLVLTLLDVRHALRTRPPGGAQCWLGRLTAPGLAHTSSKSP